MLKYKTKKYFNAFGYKSNYYIQIKVKTTQTNERNKQLFRWIIKELQFYYKLLVKIYQIQFSKLFKL